MSPETQHPMTYSASRRLVRLLPPIAMAIVLFGLLVWPGLASSFDNFRLSTIRPYDAANPDIAVAGGNLAVTWSEGYDGDVNTKEWGRVYLKSADVISGWTGRVQVSDTTNDVWGREPRLAFRPGNQTQVHLVWAQAIACGGKGQDCQWTSIWHTTCDLSTRPATCAAPSLVTAGQIEASTPDLAVDSSGGVHVVWREGPEGSPSRIRYCRKGSCVPTEVGMGTDPSIVFADNRLHVVWDAGSTIEYRRDDSPGNGSWNPGSARSWNPHTLQGYEGPSYPAIDAQQNAIYVVWAVKQSGTNKYVVAFDFYNGSTSAWQDSSGANIGFTVPGNDQDFSASTHYVSNSDVSYLYSLKPDVAVTSTGVADQAYAHVVWHGRGTGVSGGAYEVWYTYLPGINASDWSPVIKVDNESNDDAGDPAFAIGSAMTATHVAFMQDADGKGTGGDNSPIDVWYAGANGNRDEDPNVFEGSFLPLIMKNY